MSEHDIDLATVEQLRKIPFLGKMCIDMVIQARGGSTTVPGIDLLNTTDDELDDAIFGKPGERKILEDPNEPVDPDAYMGNLDPFIKQQPDPFKITTKIDPNAEDPTPVDYHYDKEKEVMILRVPMAPRHADWIERLSVMAIRVNPTKQAHLWSVQMLVRKFILEARHKDPTDAGARVNSSTMQTLPKE